MEKLCVDFYHTRKSTPPTDGEPGKKGGQGGAGGIGGFHGSAVINGLTFIHLSNDGRNGVNGSGGDGGQGGKHGRNYNGYLGYQDRGRHSQPGARPTTLNTANQEQPSTQISSDTLTTERSTLFQDYKTFYMQQGSDPKVSPFIIKFPNLK